MTAITVTVKVEFSDRWRRAINAAQGVAGIATKQACIDAVHDAVGSYMIDVEDNAEKQSRNEDNDDD